MNLWHTIPDYGIIVPFQRNYLVIILYNNTHQSIGNKDSRIKTFELFSSVYENERQEPAPRHGPGPLVPVFPALRAGRVPVRP